MKAVGSPTRWHHTDAPPGQPLLGVRELRTCFPTADGVLKAVDGVSFSLQRRQTLAIVGESGSGKTVLSRTIMGLIPPTLAMTEGEVWFDGRDLRSLGPRELRDIWGREIAVVFQDPMTSLNPVVRVGRQVTEVLRRHLGMRGSTAARRAVELLDSVGIPEPERRLRQYPHELSGGLRQRVTIAMALACEPKLLIADEPTTALDVTVQAQILDLLQHEQERRDMGLILITHDLGLAATRTDEIVVMYAGKVVEQASTAELFARRRMPYTEALMGSIPRLEYPSHTALRAIPGRPPDLIDPPPGCAFAPRCAYAQDACRAAPPPLAPTDSPAHLCACWFPVDTPRGTEARARNADRDWPPARPMTEIEEV